jgi:murein DD-endopeptidase MepM/ murein hydrolase activator NlpD
MNRIGWTLLMGFVIIAAAFLLMIRTGDEVAPPPPSKPPPAHIVTTPGPAGFAIPVAGVRPEQLVDTFEDARGNRTHGALDIMAPRGTPVVAAAPGRVEKIFESRAGGHTVYVRTDDGRWIQYYAHLDRYADGLSEGAHVSRGQLIGTVGSTGNANPEGPHLHFEVKRVEPGEKWYQGTGINPYPLLAGAPTAR